MDPHLVVVTGQALIRFLSIDAHEFKVQTTNLSKRDTNDYTCHSWVNVFFFILKLLVFMLNGY